MNAHPHDLDWIKLNLKRLPASRRNEIAEAYSKRYSELLEKNKGRIDAESLARRECNTRLRVFLDRINE